MLHRINEETDQRQLVGDMFEIAFDRDVIGGSEALDFLGAGAQGGDGAVFAHDGQCATDLMQRRLKTGKITALGDIAEEAVEHLLDLAEIALDFLGDLADQKLFLRFA